MNQTIVLNYDKSLIRSAVLSFWRRTLGLSYIFALLLLSSALGFSFSNGDRSWFIGVIATILVLGILFATALFIIHYSASTRKLHNTNPPRAELTLSDSGFVMSSSIGSSILSWTAITELWQFPQFWLLFLSKAQFITLPLTNVSLEAQSFILQQVRANGGKVA